MTAIVMHVLPSEHEARKISCEKLKKKKKKMLQLFQPKPG